MRRMIRAAPTDNGHGKDDDGKAACELCGRKVSRRTRHHLRPRSEGGEDTAWLCPPCHRQVHALFTNRTLAAELDTLEKLRASPELRGYLSWVRNQPDRHIPVRTSRSRR